MDFIPGQLRRAPSAASPAALTASLTAHQARHEVLELHVSHAVPASPSRGAGGPHRAGGPRGAGGPRRQRSPGGAGSLRSALRVPRPRLPSACDITNRSLKAPPGPRRHRPAWAGRDRAGDRLAGMGMGTGRAARHPQAAAPRARRSRIAPWGERKGCGEGHVRSMRVEDVSTEIQSVAPLINCKTSPFPSLKSQPHLLRRYPRFLYSLSRR